MKEKYKNNREKKETQARGSWSVAMFAFHTRYTTMAGADVMFRLDGEFSTDRFCPSKGRKFIDEHKVKPRRRSVNCNLQAPQHIYI